MMGWEEGPLLQIAPHLLMNPDRSMACEGYFSIIPLLSIVTYYGVNAKMLVLPGTISIIDYVIFTFIFTDVSFHTKLASTETFDKCTHCSSYAYYGLEHCHHSKDFSCTLSQ